MQYKIPIQVENEDEIVAWLSLRQLGILMWHGIIAYLLFKNLVTSIGQGGAIFIAAIPALTGVIIALWKVSHMTFLQTFFCFLRLTLNSKIRAWSQWTDSFTEGEIGYIAPANNESSLKLTPSLESRMDEEATNKILKL